MEFRLFDFSVWNDSLDEISKQRKDNKEFIIQMFGMNERGETASIIVKGFHPFFFIKVGDSWTQRTTEGFLREIKSELREESAEQKFKKGKEMGWVKQYIRKQDFIDKEMERYKEDPDKVSYYENSIIGCELLKRKKLYGFDGGKEYKFVKLTFANTTAMNKVKNLWYFYPKSKDMIWKNRKLNEKKIYMGTITKLYEAKVLPLLRLFHIMDISPSGWIRLKKFKKETYKPSNCNYNFTICYKDIEALNDKETQVPLKIMSFDIEASSSHGDFPLAKKRYEKLAGDILDYWDAYEECDGDVLRDIILAAFNFLEDEDNIIHEVFPKRRIGKENLKNKIKGLLKSNIVDYLNSDLKRGEKYEHLCFRPARDKKKAVLGLLPTHLPPLEGDKVTFIGSTFRTFGEKEPYFNHCISLDKCSEVNNVEIESYETEEEVILKWVDLIQKEKPDIIVGYNIFGFDWKFLFARAEELNCKNEFLCLSKNHNYKCKHTKKTIKIASGEHNLEYPDIPGIIQIDLYNHFRREFNFNSYKLDYVSGQLIGDNVKCVQEENERTKIESSNLMGLKVGNYICFEETGHSVDKYCEGKKMKVCEIGDKCFYLEGKENPNMNKSVRWCLAKDDVTPQDIFRLSNEGPNSKAIVAKYCVMDCKLVDILLRKTDVLMGFIETASICSVPLSFIVFRGQGIKLFSFISKKCRERGVLMPVLSRNWGDNQGYEGAICFPPRCDFYTEAPVAVVDYASLYPSSMISENLSQDSKVWTKEFDLNGEAKKDRWGEIKETGEKNIDGSWKYDNEEFRAAGYKYVDVEYDSFEYRRTTEKSAAKKIKIGTKICRFAQFPNNESAIMPSILKELLAARKSTRVMGKYKTVKTENETFIGLVSQKNDKYLIKQKGGEIAEIDVKKVKSIEDTYNDFMKNVFNQRQLGFKVTANSLYGQCGAKTSDFYDKDIAAATTATGRKLLTYAKRVIEEIYDDRICDTKYGKVKTKGEVVYGDSVTGDTPLLLKNKNTGEIEFKQIDDISNKDWRPYEGFKAGERARKEKQQNIVCNYMIYTSNGWSDIVRVIRHKTIKKMYRITTHTGMVDVTEDHSLLDENLNKFKPGDVKVGMSLCHKYPEFKESKTKLKDIIEFIKDIHNKSLIEKRAFIWGFFYGDGSCGKYECPSGLKYSWALNQKNYKFCSKLQCLLIDVFDDYFKINNTLKSSGVYKIVPNCGNIKKYVTLFRDKCYNKDKLKIIPTEFLNANYNIRFAYFAGYYAADGSKCMKQKGKSIRMDNKGKIGSAQLYYLNKSLGFNVSINTRKDKRNIIRLTSTTSKQRKDPKKIKKIEELGLSNNFVYDIETDTGNFNTGFPLIVKNTDSCFFIFNLKDMEGNKINGKKALEITIELAIEAGKYSTTMLKEPHDLEYEKTFWPFCLLSKKRYVGMLYEHDPNKCKRKSMGIVLKRRDNAAIVKEFYGGVIDILMKTQNVDDAVNFVQQYLYKLAAGEFPIEKLTISKSVRGFYKNPAQIAHKVLADRMAKRDPGNKPSAGTRIPYAFIINKAAKLQGNRIETPTFIKKNNLPLDYTHYITNQIMKPLLQVFALDNVMKNIPKLNRLKMNGLNRKINRLKKTLEEEKFKKKADDLRGKFVKELIFDPTLKKIKNKESKDAKKKFISSFF